MRLKTLAAVCSFALLSVASQCSRVTAQSAANSWPDFPKPDKSDPKYDPIKYPKGQIVNLEFLSRTPRWVQEAAPIYLRDKAFEFLNPIGAPNGQFALIAKVAKKGVGFNVFSFKKVTSHGANRPASLDEIFYNARRGLVSYSPQFSPDGNSILFSVGWFPPDDWLIWRRLVLWNRKAGTARLLDQNAGEEPIYFPVVMWSPGGRYVSYLRGGTSSGEYSSIAGSYSYDLFVYDIRSGSEHCVASDVALEWSWTHHGTLLFLPLNVSQVESVRLRTARPAIVEVDVRGGKPHQLISAGYRAQESPDGKWIAFLDWPGNFLGEAGSVDFPAPTAESRSVKPGVYLFHRPTKKRIFVGELGVDAAYSSIFLQWLPNSQILMVLNDRNVNYSGKTTRTLFRVEMAQAQRVLHQMGEWNSTAPVSELRGTSPDGRYLYANLTEGVKEPEGYANYRYTMTMIDCTTGQSTPLARLTNIVTENPDWDWHDDSGVNPAFTAAAKRENVLPLFKTTTSGRKSSAKIAKKRRPKPRLKRKQRRHTPSR